VVSPDGTKGPYYSNYDITHGTYVAAVESTTGLGFSSLKPLTVMKDVPNTAWSGRSAVTIDGRSYSVPSNVMCYNKDISSWVTLEEAHAFVDQWKQMKQERSPREQRRIDRALAAKNGGG